MDNLDVHTIPFENTKYVMTTVIPECSMPVKSNTLHQTVANLQATNTPTDKVLFRFAYNDSNPNHLNRQMLLDNRTEPPSI